MKDYTDDAEALFREFATRHSFEIEKVDQNDIELVMRVPRQTGLSFELELGLQNGDELNIGFEEFWSIFFPFESCRETVSNALDALVAGECRLATHTVFGLATKRVLELHTDGLWKTIYTEFLFPIPFFPTKTSYTYNDDVLSSDHPRSGRLDIPPGE